jgi:hypothetical protein
MKVALVWLALALGANVVSAGTGLVVLGDDELRSAATDHLKVWLQQHGHEVELDALDRDGVGTITNCLTIDDLACARGVVEQRAHTDDVVFARLGKKSDAVAIDVYWFVKGHEPLAERRACEDCTAGALAGTLDTVMGVLARSLVTTNARVHIDSDPQGLTALVDKVVVGVTPVERDLATGRHEVVLMRGAEPVGHRSIVLHPTETAEIKIRATITRPRSRLPGEITLGVGVTALAVAGVMFALSPTDDGSHYTYRDYRPPAIGIGIGGAAATIAGVVLLMRERHVDSYPVVSIEPHGGFVGWARAL